MAVLNLQKTKLPGLCIEKTPKGGVRYRVRVDGNKAKRILMPVGPEHEEFLEIYHAARIGAVLTPSEIPLRQDLQSHIRNMHKRMTIRAKERGWSCTLTRDQIAAMYHAQDRRCALTGVQFDISEGNSWRRPWAPSVDRINNQVGYTPENCRLVSIIVNTARSDWPDDVFLKMCQAVAAKNAPKPRKRRAATRRRSPTSA